MKVMPTGLQGVMVIEPKVYADERGYFFESFNLKSFCEAIGGNVDFVQDNQSKSLKNVLRGLHYQRTPKTQGKLIRVVQGEIFDVAVDIRCNSKTCGQWVGELLSAENKKQMWIPAGYAHGFLTMSAVAEVVYKVTEYYAPEFEAGIHWNDQEIGIRWPLDGEAVLSKKDMVNQSFHEYKSSF